MTHTPRPGVRRALAGVCLLAACSGSGETARRDRAAPADTSGRLFTALPSSYTGVRFENRVTETREVNVFTYRNFYNGGGVALGDLTGDGLPELVLTSNQHGNRLYLNEGEFRFRDVTDVAGVGGKGTWGTGVVVADVNGDGRLDIYVCYAGDVAGNHRANELYVNDGPNEEGIPTFTERAAELGLDDRGYTTHAAFLDYDRDGDLDAYILNNSFRPVGSFGLRNIRHVRNPLGGHKLLRNDGGRFADVSAEAGIYGSEIAFGLGLGVGDVNLDGWPDIYVANDFFEQDYLYINDGDGTFTESLERRMPYISYFSMGLDIADVDNDGWPDIYTTDMLPEDEQRLKTTASHESWDVYQAKVRNDYHHQIMRNMLQRNNRDGTFSDVGQMAGVARTDWSWSALIADLDLDGHKDIFVTNGLAKDVTSQDYISFLANTETQSTAARGKRVDFLALVEAMTSTPLPNYAFRNNGDLTFSNAAAAWGLDTPSFSNGAAYGDLNGDGALDLVVNNVNQEAFVYRNNARALTKNHWLQVALEGAGTNRFGVGAKVRLRAGGQLLFQELVPTRGFQSSVDYLLTFGLGAADSVESLTVEWPDGRVSALTGLAADRKVTVRQAEAGAPVPAPALALATPGGVAAGVVATSRPPSPAGPLLADVTAQAGIDFVHVENAFVDFDRERLIPKMVSTEGPFMAVADVNGDGLDDAFVGGAKDQPGRLLLQRRGGGFAPSSERVLARDGGSEDLGAAFFDADGDGDLDLYVVSGGNEFTAMAPALQDRLYLNDGAGALRKAEGHLPAEDISGSRVAPADFDGDGDVDLFVGGRVVPWRYGLSPRSVLLQNDGRGRFTDATGRLAPDLAEAGMVTDALWQDVDDDGRRDLVIVGEWMPITIFRNAGGGRLERLAPPGLEKSHGWWNRVVAGDFTGDGRIDFVVGNLGLNTRLRAGADEPVTMHVKDFDGNGSVEQILSVYNGGTSYPLVLRDDLIKALPYLKARFLNYEDYARRTVSDIFSPAELEGAVLRSAHTFATTLVRNDGGGRFTLVPLPREAQLAPVYGILATDVDRDGAPDLLLAGNFDGVEPELGRMSAGYGLVLKGDGKGGFAPLRAAESGFLVPGEGRDIQRLRTPRGELFVVTRNDDRPLAFRITSRESR